MWCLGCGPEAIEHPTRGAGEAIATAFLGVTAVAAGQTARLSLDRVEIVAFSGPTDGYCA